MIPSDQILRIIVGGMQAIELISNAVARAQRGEMNAAELAEVEAALIADKQKFKDRLAAAKAKR